MKPQTKNSKPDQAEPVIAWPRLYAIVLGELAVLIVLFYFFTKAFE